ncbi:MAG: hypothetical protein RM368_35645 [Nostoc sp. DedSLP03]|uniref:hypothetical protein n=1 Tax=Nostoc sp. DedSLP03 TaxID=3075400 RepID=UPI002AD55CD5|nr:hypothetical protein [Nostoc sp. DedSLP03]MDZ7970214.1 hypothetical protein [Nostoc sp. DedSLP03]
MGNSVNGISPIKALDQTTNSLSSCSLISHCKSKLERFTSLGEIAEKEVLSELFTLYSEPVSDSAELGLIMVTVT